jgi:DNA-binding MarR family transcriptional regulator
MYSKDRVTQAELAELLPLLPALTKAMTRRSHEVPASIHDDWHGHGLAPRHMNLLVSLALSGPMSVSELSTRLDVGLATASLIVGELGRVGLVVRSEDVTDRRRTIVDLAPAHRQAITAFVARRAGILKNVLASLQPQERTGLVKGLRAIVAALDTGPPESERQARRRPAAGKRSR